MTNQEYQRLERLINKYNTKQPQERWSLESERKNQRLKYMKQKLRLFDGINSEFFHLVGTQKQRAQYLIKQLDFNKICGICSDEQIIVMICYFVKCEYIKDYKRDWCKTVFKEYNISTNRLDRFMVQLTLYFANKELF